MTRKYPLAFLQVVAQDRPKGREAELLARGKIKGNVVEVEESVCMEIARKFPARPARPRPPPPTLVELTTNFSGALAAWAGAGFKVVEKEVYERRHAACLACEYWLPYARLGFGKCQKCGCSRFKLWLATSRCPDKPSRW